MPNFSRSGEAEAPCRSQHLSPAHLIYLDEDKRDSRLQILISKPLRKDSFERRDDALFVFLLHNPKLALTANSNTPAVNFENGKSKIGYHQTVFG